MGERVQGGQSEEMTSNNNDSTEAEKHKLSLMRASVECRDPSSKEVDDFTLMRFLRARNLDVEKGTALFLKYLKWRREFMPKGYVSEAEIQDDLAQNKVFLGGIDKKKRPIVVVFGGKHFQNPKPGGLEEFKRFVVYSLEKICSRMPAGQEKFLAIADFQGWGYANCDIRGYLGAFSILQDCFPERLGKLLMVNAPRMFMSAWKIVYPLIDDRTKSKIVFVESSQLRSTLLEEIDESQIPVTYGGSLQLVPIQDS